MSMRPVTRSVLRSTTKIVMGLGGGPPPVPTINLSSTAIDEGAATGRTVGALSVANGSGTYTFTITADPDSKFAISSGNLVTSAALDYETKTSHSVTIQADNGVDTPISRTFSIAVNNVLEGNLGPTTAGFAAGASAGTLITSITGLDAGANETIVSVTPNDGRLAISGGNQLVVGSSASSGGTINATLTSSAGRTLNMTITVTALPDIIAVVGAGTSNTTIPLTLAGLLADDDVVVHLTYTSGKPTPVTPAAGWTEIPGDDASAHRWVMYKRRWQAGDATNFSFTGGGGKAMTAIQFRSASPVNVQTGTKSAPSTTTSIVAPGFTLAQPARLFALFWNQSTSATVTTPPAGMTSRLANGATSGFREWLYSQDAPAGASGNKTLVVSASGPGASEGGLQFAVY